MDFEVQRYLHTCESYLMSPENIEPNELAQYFASYSSYGVNDHITSLVQRFFYLNLNHPELLRYIQLLDRLIKFSFPLPSSFISMYAECYSHSVQNGRKSIQEELKILRKLWTPILQDEIIDTLRHEVHRRTNIDIEMELREQSKRFLNDYYKKYLKLQQSQIDQIFKRRPPLRTMTQPRHALGPSFIPNRTNQSKVDQKRKNPQIKDHVEGSKTIVKEVTVRQKALMIYDLLRNMHSFSCKQCGKYFQNQQSLAKHKEQHFEQKMRKFKADRAKQALKNAKMLKKQGRMQLKISEWCNQQKIVQSKLEIPIGDEFEYNKSCKFCGCQFTISIFEDKFIFQDAIKVTNLQGNSTRPEETKNEKQGEIDLMHIQCYQTIQSTTTQL